MLAETFEGTDQMMTGGLDIVSFLILSSVGFALFFAYRNFAAKSKAKGLELRQREMWVQIDGALRINPKDMVAQKKAVTFCKHNSQFSEAGYHLALELLCQSDGDPNTNQFVFTMGRLWYSYLHGEKNASVHVGSAIQTDIDVLLPRRPSCCGVPRCQVSSATSFRSRLISAALEQTRNEFPPPSME